VEEDLKEFRGLKQDEEVEFSILNQTVSDLSQEVSSSFDQNYQSHRLEFESILEEQR
jgi:hypothetical protein